MVQFTMIRSTFFLFVSTVGSWVFAQEPNYVKTISKEILSGTTVTDKVSISYSDGLGREVQSKVVLNGTYKGAGTDVFNEVVTAKEYDAAGRVVKTYLPIPRKESAVYKAGDLSEAQKFYTGAAGLGGNAGVYPFSEVTYYDDPLGRVKYASAPGAAFNLASTHKTESYFGATSDKIASKFPTIATLESVRAGTAQMPMETDSKYFLSSIKHPNDKQYTQQITDISGRVMTTWSSPTEAGTDPLITSYKYDILGNLLEETPPVVSSSKYSYNTFGQLISKNTPDKIGDEKYEYNSAGQLIRYTLGTRVIGYSYDDLGRSTVTYEGPAAGVYKVKLRSFYDDVQKPFAYLNSAELEAVCNSATLTNVRGRVVATIAYGESCPGVTGADLDFDCGTRVIELFGYTEDGQIRTRYVSIPGIPLQKYTYDYTPIQGMLKKEIHYFDGNKQVTTEYGYNTDFQLSSVTRNGTKVIEYEYLADGSLYKKKLLKGLTGVADIENRYTARSWLASTTATLKGGAKVFEQKLSYAEPTDGTAQFGGNISKNEINYYGTVTASRKFTYGYDKINRLTKVRDGDALSSPFVNGGNILDVPLLESTDADYTYDGAGRLTYKREGDAQKWNGEYKYYQVTDNGTTKVTSRLEKVLETVNSTSGSFMYDDFGNMVVDRAKKMIIEYDWRDMPVKFMFFSSLPATITNVKTLVPTLDMVSYVEMVYDAGGNRVLKQEYKK